jgi:hypothetical protein
MSQAAGPLPSLANNSLMDPELLADLKKLRIGSNNGGLTQPGQIK